jgi:hypothetical protein
MSFQLRVQQPLKQLLNFCRLLGVSKAVAAAAVCLLNDAVAYTQLLLTEDAAVVAAAALQLAWQLVQQQQHGVDTRREDHRSGAASRGLDAAVTGKSSWEAYSNAQQQQQQRARHQHQGNSSGAPEAYRHASHQQRRSAAGSDVEGRLGLEDVAGCGAMRGSSNSHSISGSSSAAAAAAAAGDAAVKDGSWLAAVGLQQREVAEVQQALQQLLHVQQQQQQRRSH